MSFPQLRLGKARQLIESAFVVIMLRCSISGGVLDNRYSDMASRILDAFSNSAVIDVLLFAGVFAVFHLEGKNGEKLRERASPFTLVFAVLLAVLLTMANYLVIRRKVEK